MCVFVVLGVRHVCSSRFQDGTVDRAATCRLARLRARWDLHFHPFTHFTETNCASLNKASSYVFKITCIKHCLIHTLYIRVRQPF